MDYHILTQKDGTVIASFESQQDRDFCLIALTKHFELGDGFLVAQDDE